jgi:hypothetical protein
LEWKNDFSYAYENSKLEIVNSLQNNRKQRRRNKREILEKGRKKEENRKGKRK